VRCIKRLRIEFDEEEYASWHVLLGDNGSGKSSVIRSIALALTGPDEAAALRQNWAEWLRKDQEKASIQANSSASKSLSQTVMPSGPLASTT
jgi:predicted ATP-binding protein involved in virulence